VSALAQQTAIVSAHAGIPLLVHAHGFQGNGDDLEGVSYGFIRKKLAHVQVNRNNLLKRKRKA